MEDEEQFDRDPYEDYYDENDCSDYEDDDEMYKHHSLARLYLATMSAPREDVGGVEDGTTPVALDIESTIALFVFEYLGEFEEILINFHDNRRNKKENIFRYISVQERFVDKMFFGATIAPLESKWTKLPALAVSDVENESTTTVSGLCSVCREMVQLTEHTEILGFKHGCLAAPAEASVWTKFCEIDILRCVERLMRTYNGTEVTELDVELARFEMHLRQPVRIHNFAKVVQDLKKTDNNGASLEKDENDSLVIKHRFVEGPKMFLSDLILYGAYYFVFRRLSKENLSDVMPLTVRWYESMDAVVGPEIMDKLTRKMTITALSIAPGIELPPTAYVSLYKSDPKRYKPRKRIFTKQSDMDAALEKIALIPVDMVNGNPETRGKKMCVDWSKAFGMPEEGDLPKSRLDRKQDQLKSMVQEIYHLTKPGDVIVDFCSGSGHLGLLIASLFPCALVVLLENKPESLERARKRANALNLSNVEFVQTNLDYFVGDFNIGLSLHACGVATDIVMQLCVQKKAHFICCPCCYGGVLEMPHIRYPRSEFFRKPISGGGEPVKLTAGDYFCIAHGSDQSHAEDVVNTLKAKCDQGQLCMDIIDYDRRMYAEEQGYKVIATKLEPVTCTQKNRLLIGEYVGRVDKWTKKKKNNKKKK